MASMPRFYCPLELACSAELELPPTAARHVQVLRLQPGDPITLFSGAGGEFEATIARMGRSDVRVLVGTHHPIEREAARAVHLAVGMPANDRMDWLVEKATELGVASIQPLATDRTVLKLSGERAQKKQLHWQGIAIAASEQCGRNRVPHIAPVLAFSQWVRTPPAHVGWVLCLGEQSQNLALRLDALVDTSQSVTVLTGPEGGLTRAEECAALDCGFAAVNLGARVLRAETASMAALVRLTLHT